MEDLFSIDLEIMEEFKPEQLMNDVDKLVDCNTSEKPPPWPTFSWNLLNYQIEDQMMVLVTLKSSAKWGFSAKDVLPESDAGCFWTLNLKLVLALHLLQGLKTVTSQTKVLCWTCARFQLLHP